MTVDSELEARPRPPRRSPTRRWPPVTSFVLGVGFAVWGLSIGIDQISDNSFFTHLATGRLILSSGIPHHDVYSFTAAGDPWVVQSWLASVLYGWIDSWFGVGRPAHPHGHPHRGAGCHGVAAHPPGAIAGRAHRDRRLRARCRLVGVGTPTAADRAGAAHRDAARRRAGSRSALAAAGVLALGQRPRLVPPRAGRARVPLDRQARRRQGRRGRAPLPAVGWCRHRAGRHQPARARAAGLPGPAARPHGRPARGHRVAVAVVLHGVGPPLPRPGGHRGAGARPAPVLPGRHPVGRVHRRRPARRAQRRGGQHRAGARDGPWPGRPRLDPGRSPQPDERGAPSWCWCSSARCS